MPSFRPIAAALTAIAGFYLAVGVVALSVGFLIQGWWAEGPVAQIAFTSVVAVVGAVAIGAVYVGLGRYSWRELGWPDAKRGGVAALRGLGLGAAMALVALVAAVLLGTAAVEISADSLPAYVKPALKVLALLAVAALSEELLFRGYPLTRLSGAIGRPWAMIVFAAVFAAAHMGNPNASIVGLTNIALASLVLSVAFFTPGGIPAAWGVHLGWNAGLGLGADAPVSGLEFNLPVLQFHAGGPGWVTGGTFGPEGGIAATLALGAGLLMLVQQTRKRGREVNQA